MWILKKMKKEIDREKIEENDYKFRFQNHTMEM